MANKRSVSIGKKINLDMTSIENREMRLGTITSWDGKASEWRKYPKC